MTKESTTEFSGSDSAQLAQTAIDLYSKNGSIQIEKIEIVTTPANHETQSTISAHGDDNSKSDASKSETDTKTGSPSDKDEPTSPTKKRTIGEIKPNTSHHRVLHVLDNLDKDGAVPGKLVKEQTTGVNKRSIYPALTQLWERKLAKRERVEDVDHPYYKYEVSDHGKEMLNEIGKPAQKES